MNRRSFVGSVAIGTSFSSIKRLSALFAPDRERPDANLQDSTPLSLHNMPIVIAGNDDDFPLFRRRQGGGSTWEEETFNREATEDAVAQLRDLGVTLVITHLFKGFGLDAESEYLDNSKRLAQLARQHGMKVGLYIGATIAYETFLLEKPDAASWLAPDYMGKPVVYPGQPFRRRVYFMHPGYRAYIRRVLEMAERQFQADLIHFDNTTMQADPAVFQHPMAIEAFRNYLKGKYSPEELKTRLGFSNVTFVVPPIYPDPMSTIDDPLAQEWADFRCQQLSDYHGEMASVVRALNPQVAIDCNPHSGISGRNTIWEEGVSYPQLLVHTDAVWGEEEDTAGVTPDGVLVSRIRSFKNASILKNTLFVETGSSTLQMAESMAFGRQCLGYVGDISDVHNLPQEQRNYIRFFHNNFEHYTGVTNIADAALLFSYPAMAFDNDGPAMSFMLYAQTLIQSKVGFDIIYNEHLKDLSKYRVLILADQKCLKGRDVDLIRQFVQAGGSLVATEYSSLYTEWRLRRPDFGLKDLFGVAAPPWPGRGIPEQPVAAGTVRRHIGTGKVVYISELKPQRQKPPAAPMTSEYWGLPLNWQELYEAVRWAAGDQLALEVTGPLTVAAELTEQREKRKLLVHLLNYDVARTPRVENVVAELKAPFSGRLKDISLFTPDGPGIPGLPYESLRNGRLRFAVPYLNTYSVIVLRFD